MVLGPTRVHNPNNISIGSAVFAVNQMNRVNSRSDHGHEDSTINIVVELLLLGRIAVLRMWMRPIVTDRVAWSVGLSVGLSH